MLTLLSIACFLIFAFIKPYQFDLTPLNTPSSTSSSFLNEDRILQEIDLLSNPLLKIEICLGLPTQCFDTLFDTASFYLWVGKQTSATQILKHTFNSSLSPQFVDTGLVTTFSYENMKISGTEVKDVFNFNGTLNNKTFTWALANSVTGVADFSFDGIVGLSRNYPGVKTINGIQVNIDKRFSLMEFLFSNSLITNKLFSYKYITRGTAKLYIGEIDSDIKDKKYPTCSCTTSEGEKGNDNVKDYWNCQLGSVMVEGNAKEKITDYAIFNTGSPYIIAPKKTASFIFSQYMAIMGPKNMCKQEGEDKYSKIICKSDFDEFEVPGISFTFMDYELTAKSYSLFQTIETASGKEKLFKIWLSDDEFWVLGEPVLKNYNLVFNHGDNSVGFAEDRSYIHAPPKAFGLKFILVVLVTFVIVIGTLIAFYFIKKTMNSGIEIISDDKTAPTSPMLP